MTKRVSLLALLGAFALFALALPLATVQASEEEMATLTGCLNPGEGEGWFVLTPEEGDPVNVTGGEDVKAHSGNHKVKLTGKWVEDDEGHKHFEATGVEHIAVCE